MTTATELRDSGSDLVVCAARLVRAIRQAVDQPTGTRVLSLLDEHGPLGVTQLADLDRCAQPTMSAMVNTLADQSQVHRDPHPHDARCSLISLTRQGRRTLADFRRQTGQVVVGRLEAGGHHSLEDLDTVVAVLRDLLDVNPDNARGNASTGTQKGNL